MTDPPDRPMRPSEVESALLAILSGPELTHESLREQMERLALQDAFGGLVWRWGPALYARSRVMFRPFILAHFASVAVDEDGIASISIAWKGEAGRLLDGWLKQVDRDDDVELFRRLYAWRLATTASAREQPVIFRRELAERMRRTTGTAARRAVLARFDLGHSLDEPTAQALYTLDPDMTRDFILGHLPHVAWWGEGRKRVLWENLWREARKRHDVDFAATLYRRQVPLDRWITDALALCNALPNETELGEALERMTPEGFNLDLGDGLARLLERRGRPLLPYAMRQLRNVRAGWGTWIRSGRGYDRLMSLAKDRQWHDLWAALLRLSATPADFNRELVSLLDNRTLPAVDVRERLLMVAGVVGAVDLSPGDAGGRVLLDPVAVKLYERFPELLVSALRPMLAPYDAYPKLVDAVLARGDEALADILASRLVTRVGIWDDNKRIPSVEQLAAYYHDLLQRDTDAFARRACSILTRVAPYTIFDYRALLRDNRLARLLFERSASSLLACPEGLRDLVEAPEIHVQALAYRTLGADDSRAREAASSNLPVLLGTLLRPLHQKTRRLAFRALLSAATTLENASTIHDRARQALDLPDRAYPKERLIGLIGMLLSRFPPLRSASEEPTVYPA